MPGPSASVLFPPGVLSLNGERLAAVRRIFSMHDLMAMPEADRFALVCPKVVRAIEILELFMRRKDGWSFGLIARARKMAVIILREWMDRFARFVAVAPGSQSGPVCDEVEEEEEGAAARGRAGWILCVGDLAAAALRVAYVMMNLTESMPHERLLEATGLEKAIVARVYETAGSMVGEGVGATAVDHINALTVGEWMVVKLMASFQASIFNERAVRVHASSLLNRFLGLHLDRIYRKRDHPRFMDMQALACAAYMVAVKLWESKYPTLEDLAQLTTVSKASIRAAERDVLAALEWNVYVVEGQLDTLHEFQPAEEMHDYELVGEFKDMRPEDDA